MKYFIPILLFFPTSIFANEWIQTPSGTQWALVRDEIQIGVWIPNDGYYEKTNTGWSSRSIPPIPPPSTVWPLKNAMHDFDLNSEAPWPTYFDRPPNLTRYKRAAYTQSIAITDGRDTIDLVPRLKISTKWQHSGGLEAHSGWRSDLYRNDRRPKMWIGDITIKNGNTHTDFSGNTVETTQENRGWKREYPNGALFLDVLSKNRVVFEIRQLEKKNGKWNPSIIYRNIDARPNGYTGLNVPCMSCHATKPGSGGYNVGLIPGGDSIFSDPFPALERK